MTVAGEAPTGVRCRAFFSGRLIEEVFADIFDVEQFPTLMPSVDAVQILDQSEDQQYRTVSWRVSLRGAVLCWTEVATVYPAERRVHFLQADGDLDTFEGHWEVEEAEGTVWATVQVSLRVGIPALARMLQPLAANALRDSLTEMLTSLGGTMADQPEP